MAWRLSLMILPLCLSAGVRAQQPTPPATPPAQTTTPATPTITTTPTTAAVVPAAPRLALTGDAAFVIWTVKSEGAGDFEAFLAKVREALALGTKPEHARMAAGLKLFKVTGGVQSGQVLYASIIDPAVLIVDYDPVKILSEVMPAEAAAMYPKFKDALVTVNRLNLVDPNKPPAPATPATPGTPTAPAASTP